MLPHRFTVVAVLAFAPAVTAQMSGTFYINPLLPLTSSTFPSFADATAELAAQGVGGPCEFLVYDDGGPYTEANAFTTSNVTYGTSDAVLTMTSWTGSSSTNRVTFRAAPGERPVLDATGVAMGVFWGGADYVTLKGLEIRNATFDGITLYAEAQHGIAADPIIDECRVHDCNGTAVTVYGNSAQPANTLIQNCTFWSCQLTGGGGFGTLARNGYVSGRRSNGTRIVHNTFYVDTIGSNTSSYAVIAVTCSSTAEVPFDEISNNVFVKLAGSSAPMFRFSTPAGSTNPLPLVCDSNCFHDLSGGIFALHGDGAGTTASTIVDWMLLGRDTGSVSGDPLLRDVANDDFHLTAASPCIDASTLSTGVAIDADGQARTAPEDIGSDEFSAGDYQLVGAGCAGTGGLVPAIAPWSWPFLGNPEFVIGYTDAMPNSYAGMFGSLGLSPVPLPLGFGCDALLDPNSLVALAAAATGPAGTSSVRFAVPNNPNLAGVNIAYQGLVLDAGAPLSFTVSNAIDVTFDF